MFIDPQPVATKTIVPARYIGLLKECELSVGAAAINMAPLAGWWCGSFMNYRAAELLQIAHTIVPCYKICPHFNRAE
jgi:hypothetical protein